MSRSRGAEGERKKNIVYFSPTNLCLKVLCDISCSSLPSFFSPSKSSSAFAAADATSKENHFVAKKFLTPLVLIVLRVDAFYLKKTSKLKSLLHEGRYSIVVAFWPQFNLTYGIRWFDSFTEALKVLYVLMLNLRCYVHAVLSQAVV